MFYKASRIFELPYRQLHEGIKNIAALQWQLLRVLSRGLTAAQEPLVSLGRQQAQKCLSAFLCRWSERFIRRSHDPVIFFLPMTRDDIANYLGLTVKTISRLFLRFAVIG